MALTNYTSMHVRYGIYSAALCDITAHEYGKDTYTFNTALTQNLETVLTSNTILSILWYTQ